MLVTNLLVPNRMFTIVKYNNLKFLKYYFPHCQRNIPTYWKTITVHSSSFFLHWPLMSDIESSTLTNQSQWLILTLLFCIWLYICWPVRLLSFLIIVCALGNYFLSSCQIVRSLGLCRPIKEVFSYSLLDIFCIIFTLSNFRVQRLWKGHSFPLLIQFGLQKLSFMDRLWNSEEIPISVSISGYRKEKYDVF